MTTKQIKVLPEIMVKQIKVKIKGKTPLLMDRFPDTAKEQILAKQTGLAKGNKKLIRNTEQEIQDAVHVTRNGKVGFPAYGFKKGMMESTSFVGDKSFSKKLVSSIQINTDDGLIPITYKKQEVLERQIGHITKFSPCFIDWGCELTITFDSNSISESDIITLLNYAGFYNGIGSWRPKCSKGGSGNFGMFEVEKVKK